MNPIFEHHLLQTRRQFFGDAGLRLGSLALGMLMGSSASGSKAHAATGPQAYPPLPGLPHFPGKAKSLIYLHMNGAPTQMDLWDYKPNLEQFFDKDLPDSVRMGQRITTMTSGQSRLPVAPSKFKFAQHGQCGRWVSELLPHTAKIVDDLALIKTVHTNAINHDPACTFVMTGSEVPGKPSIGSWLAYGLGSESNDLPAFVVFTPKFPADRQRPGVVLANVDQRLSAVQVQRRRAARRRRSGAVRAKPAGRGHHRSPQHAGCLEPAQPARLRTLRRPGDPDANRPVRNGLSHAEFRAGVGRLVEGAAAHPGPVRPGGNHAGHVQPQCAAGPALGRTRRARGPDPAPRLGPARQPAGGVEEPVPGHRPGHGGAGHGPQTARACWTAPWSCGAASSDARSIRRAR